MFIEGNLSKALDETLKVAREKKNCPVSTVTGLSGFGKTAIVKSWLEHNKLKYLWFDVPTYAISEIETEYYPIYNLGENPDAMIVSDLEELLKPVKKNVRVIFTSDVIDKMNEDTIIVFDNYGAASKEVREEFFRLIEKLQVVDPRVKKENKLKRVMPLMMILIITTGTEDDSTKYSNIEKEFLGLKF